MLLLLLFRTWKLSGLMEGLTDLWWVSYVGMLRRVHIGWWVVELCSCTRCSFIHSPASFFVIFLLFILIHSFIHSILILLKLAYYFSDSFPASSFCILPIFFFSYLRKNPKFLFYLILLITLIFINHLSLTYRFFSFTPLFPSVCRILPFLC